MKIKCFISLVVVLNCFIHPVFGQPSGKSDGAPNLEEQSKKLAEEEEELLKRVQGLQKTPTPPIPIAKTGAIETSKVPVETSVEPKRSVAAKEDKLARTEKKLSQVCGCSPEALVASQERVQKLSAELEEARNRLLLSETEVERLAKIVDERIKGSKLVENGGAAQLSNRSIDIQPKVARDLPIATVSVAQAQLRSAPEKNASVLSTAQLGTRLAVETRSGSWYRIISPNGSRAWVSADMIDFGSGRAGSAVKSKGIEQENF